ncbi:MAG: hypothetical protein DMF62_06650 [Acidobacteria bacterium]|nr:MAG: hypothetical protein DMF62_06650 [Acidobacteriota bacterium]
MERNYYQIRPEDIFVLQMKFRISLVIVLAVVAAATLRFNQGEAAEKPVNARIGAPIAATALQFARSETIESVSDRLRSERAKNLNSDPVFRDRKSSERNIEYKPSKNSTDAPQRAEFSSILTPSPILSFDGISNFNNVAAFGLIIAPPDMVGEAGPDHYVQVANTLFRVYSKTGQPLTAPIPINHLFLNLGTPCSSRNDGLPNIVYDQLADRWMISQVCSNFPPFRQMIAVSQTGDPLGGWFAYEFVMPNVKINDFPKMSMWPDGYYMTTNEVLGSDYTGTGIFAFDRKKMLAGDPAAGYVYFSLPATIAVPGGMLPADLDGLNLPPAGTPAIIATHTATEYGDANDAIRLYDFHADFEHPSASTLAERAESPIVVASFDPSSPAGRADISQPPPGDKLDSVSDTLMSRLTYRNLGPYQTLVANQTVRLTPSDQTYRAGVRVYEFRNSSGTFVPFVQSTIGDATSSRWIATAAQDHQGNTAVQYNFVADEKRVSIVYTGRLANDPANTFRAERSLVDGTGVQKGFGWRWGEYSAMSVDPSDDCTFWITNAYYSLESEQFSDFGWLTRIGTFKFDECTPAPKAAISGIVTNSVTGASIKDVSVEAYQYSRQTSANGAYGPLTLLPGQYQLKVSKPGYRDALRSIDIADGQTQHQDFALEPVPVIVTTGQTVSAESCGLNRAADPGETVTLNIALRNTGAADIASLDAELLPIGGVTSPGPTQNYGAMPAGGSATTRSFTFTVSPSVACGSAITLSLQLSDGSTGIGVYAFALTAGTPKIALAENFDRTPSGGLPSRWTRSAFTNTGAPDPTRNWILSGTRSISFTKSVFSPDPFQPGVNELVSPVFVITSPSGKLTFKNWYELETTFLRNRLFDGSVLEIRYDGGDWQDIIAAGGEFESGGYDGTIDGCCQNPLAGHRGWSGRSGVNQASEFIRTSVKLPVSAAGHKVQLRWRVGTDIGTFREGQYIDDLVVTDGYACSCGN